MTKVMGASASPKPALVASDEAPAGLHPTGFDPARDEALCPRSIYEAGGWRDGRLGQAYDLLAAVLTDRGERVFRHPLLTQIEAMDDD